MPTQWLWTRLPRIPQNLRNQECRERHSVLHWIFLMRLSLISSLYGFWNHVLSSSPMVWSCSLTFIFLEMLNADFSGSDSSICAKWPGAMHLLFCSLIEQFNRLFWIRAPSAFLWSGSSVPFLCTGFFHFAMILLKMPSSVQPCNYCSLDPGNNNILRR